jgi:outer membrane protein assembly factor BamE (lipoprotein component of BamABCDE complex)
MKWIVVVLIGMGILYLGKNLMPSATAIDTQWMLSQVKQGMTREEVVAILGGNPESRARSGVGEQETWFYSDRYDEKDTLEIDFIDGRVLRVARLDR